MASPEEDEIKAYQARLKKPRLNVSPKFLVVFAMVLAYFAYLGWTFSWKNPLASSKPDAEPAVTASGPPAPPTPPTPRELTQRALQSVADTYAPLDETALPEAPIALARGRKVVFVQQSQGFDPETARLLRTPERSPVKIIALPGNFVPGTPPELAVDPREVGVVVLERETMAKVGTYTGGNEPAIEITKEMVAILVPERKRVAAFRHTVKPKDTVTRTGRGKNSVVLGTSNLDDGWMSKAASALHEGRAPESTVAY